MPDKVKLSGIVGNSIVDGKGMRMTVFTQGCPHHCEGCHNPHTHDFTEGYFEEVSSIMEKFKKDPLARGITLSGGEPFCQARPLIELCKEVKSLKKDIWAYSGYTYEQIMEGITPNSKELLTQIDVLVDGKFKLEQRDLTLNFRGSSNQRVIDVQKSLENDKVILLELDY
ncbi:MAG: anaerobic ribonucleoside-triphosphate reductase activating protein [Oscillospiraceae bacterium]